MDIKIIQSRVAEIGVIAEGEEVDNEEGHYLEDQLYIDFIEYIATTDNLPSISKLKLMAQEVIKAKAIRFTRWYA